MRAWTAVVAVVVAFAAAFLLLGPEAYAGLAAIGFAGGAAGLIVAMGVRFGRLARGEIWGHRSYQPALYGLAALAFGFRQTGAYAPWSDMVWVLFVLTAFWADHRARRVARATI